MSRANHSSPPPAPAPRPRRRAPVVPAWKSELRPIHISTMSGLEAWVRTAEPDHPLRRALFTAQLALECDRSDVRIFSKSTVQGVLRERRALLKTPESMLFEFCEKFLGELASMIRVCLPPDGREAQQVLQEALRRACIGWRKATEGIARMMRTPPGRPPCLATGSLLILCQEIARCPLVGMRMKKRALPVVAAWAAKASGRGFKSILRSLYRERRNANSAK